jgi:RimJ/RimL family protein N-acetyltransferase
MEILTRRLMLRRLDVGDVEAMAVLFADPAVRRHLAITAMDADEAYSFAGQFIRESRTEFRDAGTGAMAIQPLGGAVAIGYCGLRPLPEEARVLELMYSLRPGFWGLGLATEAARAALDWGLDALAIDEVIGLCRPDNEASGRVMQKLAMAYSGVTERYYGDRLKLFRLPRHLWRQGSVAALSRPRRPG